MYIIKDTEGKIIAISDTLEYQENGNPLIDNGNRAIAAILVEVIEESDTMPEGWTYENGVYYEPVTEKPSDENVTVEDIETAILEGVNDV